MTTKGFIRYFDVRKRYGFIVPNGVSRQEKDRHVYFYEDVLQGEVTSGEIVEFTLNPNYPNPIYPNPRAESVRVLSKAVPINQQQRKAAYGTD